MCVVCFNMCLAKVYILCASVSEGDQGGSEMMGRGRMGKAVALRVSVVVALLGGAR